VESVAKGDDYSFSQASILVKRFPGEALDAIGRGLKASSSDFAREFLLLATRDLHSAEAYHFVLDQMANGRTPLTRVTAARLVARRDPEAATKAAMAEWRKVNFRPMGVVGSDDVAVFLLETQRPEAVDVIAEALPKQSPGERILTLQWIPMDFNAPLTMDNVRKPSDEVRRAYQQKIEGLLADELNDRDLVLGLGTSMGGVPLENPRVCDFAAAVLARILPSRYQYVTAKSSEDFDRQRIASLNVWRRQKGLAPEQPIQPSIREISASIIDPLMRTVLTEPRRKKPGLAEKQILALGLPALKPILQCLHATPRQNEARKVEGWNDLAHVSRLIALTVREVKVKQPGPGSEPLMRVVKSLEGHSLSTPEVKGVLDLLLYRWPKKLRGAQLSFIRGVDGAGFVCTVDFSKKSVLKRGWEIWDFVRVGNEKGKFGEGYTVRPTEFQFKWFVHRVDEACKESALTALNISFGITKASG